MHAADSARPTATGASRMPGSGRRTLRPRSSRTASQPKATTRPAARIDQVSRQLRATSGATRTGRNSASASTPNCPLPTPKRASRPTPTPWPPTDPGADPPATGVGTPAIRSQPFRPNNDEAHGRLATKPSVRRRRRSRTMISTDRHGPPASSVLDGQHDTDRHHEEGERRDEGEGDRRQQRQLAQHPQASAGFDTRVPVAAGALPDVERLQAGAAAQQMDHPRTRRVAGQCTPPADRQQLRRQWHRGIHDQCGDP